MTYVRKTIDVWYIEVYYPGTGWEVETRELTFKDAKATAKCYRENINYPVRITKHRERKGA